MGVDISSVTGRRWVRGGVGSGSLRFQLKADCTGSVPVGVPVPSLSPTMGLRGVARILSLSLVLAEVATGAWKRGPLGVLLPWQGCAVLGRCCPGHDPMCVARGAPRCFCHQACRAARDCCADYTRVWPGKGKALAERSEGRGAGEGDARRKGA